MNKTQLTQGGFEKLQQEYKEVVHIKKPAAIERLQKARSMGDLSENSEYSAAKEELAFVDGRAREIEAILKNVEIIQNDHGNGNIVALGNKVSLENSSGEKQEYSIVGEFEADPMAQKLSHTSPIGKALIGKKIGDTVEVEIPAGKISYKILQIN